MLSQSSNSIILNAVHQASHSSIIIVASYINNHMAQCCAYTWLNAVHPWLNAVHPWLNAIRQCIRHQCGSIFLNNLHHASIMLSIVHHASKLWLSYMCIHSSLKYIRHQEYIWLNDYHTHCKNLNGCFDLAVVILSDTKEDKSLSSLVILRKIN